MDEKRVQLWVWLITHTWKEVRGNIHISFQQITSHRPSADILYHPEAQVDRVELGRRLRQRRQKAGLTRREAAQLLGCDIGLLVICEHGDGDLTQVRQLLAVTETW